MMMDLREVSASSISGIDINCRFSTANLHKVASKTPRESHMDLSCDSNYTYSLETDHYFREGEFGRFPKKKKILHRKNCKMIQGEPWGKI